MKNSLISRQQLYDLVWSETIQTITQKFNISTHGLKSICAKMNVPMPSFGYWAKIKYGKTVERVPMSESYDGPKEVDLSSGTFDNPLVAIQREILSDKNLDLNVPKRIGNLDPLVESARLGLNTAKESWNFINQVYSGAGNIYIRVSKAQVSRALRIMNALILAIRARGNSIKVADDKTYMVVDGIEIAFSLKEQTTRKLIKERFERTELVPTGKLYFDEGEYYPKMLVGDTTVPLEEKLHRVLAKLEFKAHQWAEWRRKREEEDRKRKIQEQKEREFKLIWENEMTMFKKLISDTQRFRLAQQMREYVDEFEARFLHSDQVSEQHIQWVSWARKKLNWFDPLIELDDQILRDEDRDRIVKE